MARKRRDETKSNLHERNRNRQRYDLKAMTQATPELSKYIKPNKNGEPSIDFSSKAAVRLLNQSILNHYYGIRHWEFPRDNLCPAIPGRAEYIHAIADLLSKSNQDKVPLGSKVTCLDVGIGASCIYPIIGVTEYDWNFIGSDIDERSIGSSNNIIDSNPSLSGKIKCVLQTDPRSIFQGILNEDEKIDVTLSNPPFHSSIKEAIESTQRKVRNLTGKNTAKTRRNFSGGNTELVYRGGELKFITNMINESQSISQNCLWFSSLVSKEYHLKKLQIRLKEIKAKDIKILEIKTGNKVSRVIAWTFHSKDERRSWSINKWTS